MIAHACEPVPISSIDLDRCFFPGFKKLDALPLRAIGWGELLMLECTESM